MPTGNRHIASLTAIMVLLVFVSFAAAGENSFADKPNAGDSPAFRIEVSGPINDGRVYLGDIKLLTIMNVYHGLFYPAKDRLHQKTSVDSEGWTCIEYGVNDPDKLLCRYEAVLKCKGTRLKYEFTANALDEHKFKGVLVWGFLNDAFFRKDGFGKKFSRAIPDRDNKDSLGDIEQGVCDTVFGKFRFRFTGEGESRKWYLRDSSIYSSSPTDFGFGIYTPLELEKQRTVKYSFEMELLPGSDFELRRKLALHQKLATAIEKDSMLPRNRALEAFSANYKRLKAMYADFDNHVTSIKRLVAEGNKYAKKVIEQRPVYSSNVRWIVPQPQESKCYAGSYLFDEKSVIVLPAEVDIHLRTAAEDICNDLKNRFGFEVKILTGKASDDGVRAIEISDSATCEDNSVRRRLPEHPEGYVLSIKKDRIQLVGTTSIGTVRGAQSILLLLAKNRDLKIDAPCCYIRDWPDMDFRSVVICTRGKNRSALTYDALRLAIRFKDNAIFFDSRFHALKTGPIREDTYQAVPVDMLRDLVKIAKSHGVSPIPILQIAGHSDHILRLKPELSESQDKSKPGATYCLSNPKVKEFLAEQIDETLDVFDRPENFHIGCDEISLFCQCDNCKKSSADKLLADHVNWTVDYLKKRGVKNVFMWHDMLLSAADWGGTVAHSGSAAYRYATHPALNRISKDVIIGFWSYHETGDFPALKHFMDKGFRVFGTSWMQDDSCYQMADAVKKLGAYGVSVWPSPSVENNNNIIAAENSWTNGQPAFDRIRYDQDEIVNSQRSVLPSGFYRTVTHPLDISSFCNLSLINRENGNSLNWDSAHADLDLRFLSNGRVRLGGIDFVISTGGDDGRQCVAVGMSKPLPQSVKDIKVADKARSMVFLHTAIGDTERRGKVGSYVVNYEDGSLETIDIIAAENIITSTKNYSSSRNWQNYPFRGALPGARRVWKGFSIGGVPMDLQALEWINPFPEKQIASVDLLVHPGKEDYSIRLIALSIVK